MPYIKQENKSNFDEAIEKFKEVMPSHPGELNFFITRIVQEYLVSNGKSYTKMNEVVGVIECMKLELYRRIISDYEDEKILENGDVLPNWT